MLAAFARAIDIESWALLIPGGFVGRVTQRASVPRAAGVAKAAALVERLLLGALACVVIGHYVASVSATAIAGWRFTGYVRPEDLATPIAIVAIGLLWLRTRIGRDVGRERDGARRLDWRRRSSCSTMRLGRDHDRARRGVACRRWSRRRRSPSFTGWVAVDAALALVLGFALTLPVVGGGDALARAAHELPPPRVQALQAHRPARRLFFASSAIALGTFLVVLLVPGRRAALWTECAAGRSRAASGRARPRSADLMAIALAGAAVLLLVPAAHAALGDAEQMLHRFSADGTLPSGLALAAHAVRHARPRDRRHRRRDDRRGARQRRPRRLAGARRTAIAIAVDARADGRRAGAPAAHAPGAGAVQGARQRAHRQPRASGRSLRRRPRSSR